MVRSLFFNFARLEFLLLNLVLLASISSYDYHRSGYIAFTVKKFLLTVVNTMG